MAQLNTLRKQVDETFFPFLLNVEEAGISIVRSYGINGDPYGPIHDGTFGLIKTQAQNPGAKALFMYRAPVNTPKQNPVALYVELEHNGKEKLMLVSNVLIRNPVSMQVAGVEVTPVRAMAALIPLGLQISIMQEGPIATSANMSIIVPSPKVGRHGFHNSNAVAALVYTKGSKPKGYASSYDSKNNTPIYTDGEVLLHEVDRVKGLVRGEVRGTLMHQIKREEGDILEPIQVHATFLCKINQ